MSCCLPQFPHFFEHTWLPLNFPFFGLVYFLPLPELYNMLTGTPVLDSTTFICFCMLSETLQISSVFCNVRPVSLSRRSLTLLSRMPNNKRTRKISSHWRYGFEITTFRDLPKFSAILFVCLPWLLNTSVKTIAFKGNVSARSTILAKFLQHWLDFLCVSHVAPLESSVHIPCIFLNNGEQSSYLHCLIFFIKLRGECIVGPRQQELFPFFAAFGSWI